MDELTPEKYNDVATYFLRESSNIEPRRYTAFLNLYKRLTTPETVEGGYKIQVDEDHLQSHEYIRKIVGDIRANPTLSRNDFVQRSFPKYVPPVNSGNDPTAIIVQLAFMLNCNSKDRYSRNRRIGDWQPSRWENDESFHDFVSKTLPIATQGILLSQQDRDILAAWKLKSRCNIEIEGTENLAEHLLYDPKTKRLLVFHHTSWLHAQLERLTKAGDSLASRDSLLTLDTSLKAGALPRQVILETLDSFYRILFPSNTDRRRHSRKLLDYLIKHAKFDPNAISQNYSLPEGFEYSYWGDRLRILRDLANLPPPTSKAAKWMERHKAERNILWIAIAGLFLSAFFGLVSCIIGGLQLWVGLIALKQSPS